MNAEANINMMPFPPDIFTGPSCDDPPVLLGGFCSECNDYFFPVPRYCPGCLGRVQKTRIGSKGSIYSFTVVRTPPLFGLPSPYSIGYVDLFKTGLRVIGLLDPENIEKLTIGARVVLSVSPLGHDGNGIPCLRPSFVLEKTHIEEF